MKESESKVLETAAILYNALPGYLAQTESKQQIGHLLIDLIDALDDVEYSRSGTPLFDIIGGSVPGRRKRAILSIERDYRLTEREGHILRYLANERNPTYIANALGISPSTAKAHKYSIFKKLGVHTSNELRTMLAEYDARSVNGAAYLQRQQAQHHIDERPEDARHKYEGDRLL